jgi:hypothetical protein
MKITKNPDTFPANSKPISIEEFWDKDGGFAQHLIKCAKSALFREWEKSVNVHPTEIEAVKRSFINSTNTTEE